MQMTFLGGLGALVEMRRLPARQEWELARRQIPAEALDAGMAERQIERFLEFYAAWAPLDCETARAAR